jgi:hypothetical protein
VASDGQHGGTLSSRDADRIAEAFELSADQVHADADLTANWQGDDQELIKLLQEQHEWDASVPPFYVFWLRGDGTETPE